LLVKDSALDGVAGGVRQRDERLDPVLGDRPLLVEQDDARRYFPRDSDSTIVTALLATDKGLAVNRPPWTS